MEIPINSLFNTDEVIVDVGKHMMWLNFLEYFEQYQWWLEAFSYAMLLLQKKIKQQSKLNLYFCV